MKSWLSLLLFVVLFLFTAGCASDENQENKAAQSKLPWGRPASWENQLPGFGGAGF